jgi:hypothetical protein
VNTSEDPIEALFRAHGEVPLGHRVERDRAIVEMYRIGWSAREIAEFIGMGRSSVFRILQSAATRGTNED